MQRLCGLGQSHATTANPIEVKAQTTVSRGPGSCLRSRGWGVTPVTLPSRIPIAQSLGALIPPAHLPLKGQRTAFREPAALTYRAWEGTGHTEAPGETSPPCTGGNAFLRRHCYSSQTSPKLRPWDISTPALVLWRTMRTSSPYTLVSQAAQITTLALSQTSVVNLHLTHWHNPTSSAFLPLP